MSDPGGAGHAGGEGMSDYERKRWAPVIGRPLRAVEIEEDGAVVVFRFLDGRPVRYRAEGDCCSSSWVEYLTVPRDIKGAVITDVSEPRLEPHAPVVEEDYESIAVYHTAFATAKGEVIVEYRNSSNGYYGGWLEMEPENMVIDGDAVPVNALRIGDGQ